MKWNMIIRYINNIFRCVRNYVNNGCEIRTFDKYKRNIYSQNGEDGVTQEILKRLKINKGWFCEFGAWDGKYLSNTYFLISKGWRGVYIEGDKDKFENPVRNVKNFKEKVYPVSAYIRASGKNSLDNVLAKTPLPVDFDILSIDIDGDDYFVWKNLNKYKPKIVIIEVNSGYLPSVKITSAKSNKGTSFSSMVLLGKKKGYLPVYHTGNIFFVRKDYVNNLGVTENELRDSTTLFDYSWLLSKSAMIK